MTVRHGWLIGGVAYVVMAGGLAVIGGLTRTALPYLATLDVVLLMAAAAGNVLLASSFCRACRRLRAAEAGGGQR